MRDILDFDILHMPGWHDSQPGHWMPLWRSIFPSMRKVEQEDWDNAVYSAWAARLSEAVAGCRKPVLLIAYSLGTSLTVRWAQEGDTSRIAGAFLAAPSDRDQPDNNPLEIKGFAPMITRPLPFPSMVVASINDPRVAFERAKFFASCWGSTFVDAGASVHLGVELGVWPQGLAWLGQFIGSLPEDRESREARDMRWSSSGEPSETRGPGETVKEGSRVSLRSPENDSAFSFAKPRLG